MWSAKPGPAFGKSEWELQGINYQKKWKPQQYVQNGGQESVILTTVIFLLNGWIYQIDTFGQLIASSKKMALAIFNFFDPLGYL